jgi:hypothetical protein
MVDDGATNLHEDDAAPCIAQGDNQRKGMHGKSGNDVGRPGSMR